MAGRMNGCMDGCMNEQMNELTTMEHSGKSSKLNKVSTTHSKLRTNFPFSLSLSLTRNVPLLWN